MVKFGHIGDIHLGEKYPQGALDRLEEIKNRGIKAFKWMIKKDVDFILMSGDIFDTPNPGEYARMAFAEMMEPILKRNIPTIIIPGQHDKVTDELHAHLGIDALLQAVGGVAFYFVDKLRVIKVHKGVAVLCQPWERIINPINWVKPISKVKPLVDHLILLGHFGMKGGLMSSSYIAPTGVSKLALKPFTYVALGDYHGQQPNYCGSLARLDFGERDEKKGFKWVTIDNDEVEVKFVSMPDREFYVANYTWEAASKDVKIELINDCLKNVIDDLELLEDCNLKIVVSVPQDVSRVVDVAGLQKYAREKRKVRYLEIDWELQRREVDFFRLEGLSDKEPSEVLKLSSRGLLRTFVEERWDGAPGKKNVFNAGARLLP